ncbi:hypothetical protein [Pseudomonas laurylsulfatiphila]|uniref:hypothetical protein n=1 Tax=Pseudomonas laurylsulfatiphila TaxID=2011015 RepID=UPI003D259614
MKKIGFTLLLLASINFAHAEPVPASIAKQLKPLDIKAVVLTNDVLRVDMNRPRVTEDIYATVVNNVCTSLILEPGSWGNTDFRRIEVVNSFGAQGRVFTGGAAECRAIGKLNMDQVNQEFLPEHTSLWSAPSN